MRHVDMNQENIFIIYNRKDDNLPLTDTQEAVCQVVCRHRDPVPAIRVPILSKGRQLPKELGNCLLVVLSFLTIHDVLTAEEVRQVSPFIFQVHHLRDLLCHISGWLTGAPELVQYRLTDGFLVSQYCWQQVGEPLGELFQPGWVVGIPPLPADFAAEPWRQQVVLFGDADNHTRPTNTSRGNLRLSTAVNTRQSVVVPQPSHQIVIFWLPDEKGMELKILGAGKIINTVNQLWLGRLTPQWHHLQRVAYRNGAWPEPHGFQLRLHPGPLLRRTVPLTDILVVGRKLRRRRRRRRTAGDRWWPG